MAQDAIINRWDINGDVYDIQDAGRGRPLGVATLDENGRVPYTQLPESAVEFKGYWNADTNTPHLQDGTGTKGDLYYVDVAGTQDLGSGSQSFYVGDRVLYDGSVWKNISGDLLERAQQLFNLVHPVGEIYIQYPQQKDPEDLYNHNGISSTWTLQTQYGGAFFRSSGGNADTFIEEGNALNKQAGQNLEHNHGMQHYHSMSHTHNRGSMNITGKFGCSVPQNHANYCSSAFTSISLSPNAKQTTGSTSGIVYGYQFDAKNSGAWTGLTSNVLNTSGSAISNNLTGGSVNSSAGARTSTDNSGGTENRPDNFTVQIWKRTA